LGCTPASSLRQQSCCSMQVQTSSDFFDLPARCAAPSALHHLHCRDVGTVDTLCPRATRVQCPLYIAISLSFPARFAGVRRGRVCPSANSCHSDKEAPAANYGATRSAAKSRGMSQSCTWLPQARQAVENHPRSLRERRWSIHLGVARGLPHSLHAFLLTASVVLRGRGGSNPQQLPSHHLCARASDGPIAQTPLSPPPPPPRLG